MVNKSGRTKTEVIDKQESHGITCEGSQLTVYSELSSNSRNFVSIPDIFVSFLIVGSMTC